MFGFPRGGRAPSADELETGERLVAALDDVRFVPTVVPGHVGRLALTDRYVRFTATGAEARDLLHGAPDLGGGGGGGRGRAGPRLAVPITDVQRAWKTESLGVFSVLHVQTRDGRTLVFHVGRQSLSALLAALPRNPR